MNLVIRKERDKFIVQDKDTRRDKSVKYDREDQALRFIKWITKFPGDFRELKVERIYPDTATPQIPSHVEPINAVDILKEDVLTIDSTSVATDILTQPEEALPDTPQPKETKHRGRPKSKRKIGGKTK